MPSPHRIGAQKTRQPSRVRIVLVTPVAELLTAEVAQLVALAPQGGDGRLNTLIRRACASAVSLPALPADIEVVAPDSERESVAVHFAEQFSADVSNVTDDERRQLLSVLGKKAFHAVVLTYIADFAPRVRAGLQALGKFDESWQEIGWDRATDAADLVFNRFLPAVARSSALDPLTSEIVRLRGASQHDCRLCKSLRERAATDTGGSELLYGDIERYETSNLLTLRHKAALRYADALIWTPAKIPDDVIADVRRYFSDDEAAELTFDVMRNASNKIAVALAADAPRVQHGTEPYRILADGSTRYG
jgi:alkylhydroperoxidase family enzyme